MNMPAKHLTFK